MILVKEDRCCKNCVAYEPTKNECRKTPEFVVRQPEDWCLQFITWIEQTHPGADPLDNWRMQTIFVDEDQKEIDNPLGRDLVITSSGIK